MRNSSANAFAMQAADLHRIDIRERSCRGRRICKSLHAPNFGSTRSFLLCQFHRLPLADTRCFSQCRLTIDTRRRQMEHGWTRSTVRTEKSYCSLLAGMQRNQYIREGIYDGISRAVDMFISPNSSNRRDVDTYVQNSCDMTDRIVSEMCEECEKHAAQLFMCNMHASQISNILGSNILSAGTNRYLINNSIFEK